MQRAALRFRAAELSDVEAVVGLVQSAYRGEQSRVGWTTEADLLAGQRTDQEEVRALIAGREAQLWLALRAEELVGTMLLSDREQGLYIGMLAVRPTAQALGIGRALLAEAERCARARSLSRLRMSVIAQRTELIAWYERRGYRRTGERAPFPYGQPRFGLPRRADLYFELLEKRLS